MRIPSKRFISLLAIANVLVCASAAPADTDVADAKDVPETPSPLETDTVHFEDAGRFWWPFSTGLDMFMNMKTPVAPPPPPPPSPPIIIFSNPCVSNTASPCPTPCSPPPPPPPSRPTTTPCPPPSTTTTTTTTKPPPTTTTTTTEKPCHHTTTIPSTTTTRCPHNHYHNKNGVYEHFKSHDDILKVVPDKPLVKEVPPAIPPKVSPLKVSNASSDEEELPGKFTYQIQVTGKFQPGKKKASDGKKLPHEGEAESSHPSSSSDVAELDPALENSHEDSRGTLESDSKKTAMNHGLSDWNDVDEVNGFVNSDTDRIRGAPEIGG